MVLNNETARLMLNVPTALEFNAVNGSSAYLRRVHTRFIIDVVQRLDELHHFKNYISYISNNLNLTQGTGNIIRKFWSTFAAPNLLVHQSYSSSTPMSKLISSPALVLIYTTDPKDPIMELAAQSLSGVRWFKTMFVLFPNMTKKQVRKPARLERIIKNIYDWAWYKQFTNTLLLSIYDSLYIQQPYPTRAVINKTKDWNASDFFIPYAHDMLGYQIRTPIYNDIPRVFKSQENGQSYVHGTSGQLFLNFLQYINATLVDTSMNYSFKDWDFRFFSNLLSQRVYDILIHSFTAIGGFATSYSYPIDITDWCIMVPQRSPSSEYIFSSIDNDAWLILTAFVIYMSVALWFCTPMRPREYSVALLQTISTFANSPPIAIMKGSSLRIRGLCFLFFVMGIVTTTMYTSKMTSFFASPPEGAQLNSVQDIIDANLHIMSQEIEYELMRNHSAQFPQKFLPLVDLVTLGQLAAHRDNLDTRFGYTVPSDRWKFLNRQQKYLFRPMFRLTNICAGPFYHVFPLNQDSHLSTILQQFIMKAQQAGLMEHWNREAFWQALRLGLVHIRKAAVGPQPLDMRIFGSAFFTWCLGLVISGLVFVIEMKWHQYSAYRDRSNIKKKKKKKRNVH